MRNGLANNNDELRLEVDEKRELAQVVVIDEAALRNGLGNLKSEGEPKEHVKQ